MSIIKKIGLGILATMGTIMVVTVILSAVFIFRYCTTLGIPLF